MDASRILQTKEGELTVTPLKFWENWRTVGLMFRNYPTGLDVAWDAETRGNLRRIYKRFVEIPLYMAVQNEGYSLRDGSQILGLLYLQHPYLITHINDIEINKPYRGRGYSGLLLNFAEERARQLHKKFMTLAVTLTNKRAFDIYVRQGYVEQHDRYYQLSRKWWSESNQPNFVATPITTQSYLANVNIHRIGLRQLGRNEANRSMLQFFKLETEATNPIMSAVWLQHYQPILPPLTKGRSYAITLGSNNNAVDVAGHADLFDNDDWVRWRVFLDPAKWDDANLKALLEVLINEARTNDAMTLAFGSSVMHERVKNLAYSLGLQERFNERTLMIKVL